LVLLTLVAGQTWHQRRDTAVDQARDRVFRRFVLGLIVFWIVAVTWFLWGLGWRLTSDWRWSIRSESAGSLGEHHVGDQGRFVERHLLASG
jgi:hypothetical protein